MAAFAYAMACSEVFLKLVVADIEPSLASAIRPSIHLQTGRLGFGITDIELRFYGAGILVFEAKIGSVYPSFNQLAQYAKVCLQCKLPTSRLIALTGLDAGIAPLPTEWSSLGVAVSTRSWRWARRLARRSRKLEGRSNVRFILEQFIRLSEDFVGLERAYSNLVYVVSLGPGTPENWPISWIEIVEQFSRYFYPFGSKSWPPPPNYVAFRYRGPIAEHPSY